MACMKMAQRGPYKKFLSDMEAEMPASTKRRRLQEQTTDADTVHGDICSEMESQEPSNAEHLKEFAETEHEQYTDSAEMGDVDEYPEAEPEEVDHERSNSSDEESEEPDDPQNAERNNDINSETAPKQNKDNHAGLELLMRDPLHLDDGDKPIYPGSDVTKAETILMILTFVLRHKISGEGLKDFLSLLHILFPSILPATKYLFDKYFLSITNQFEIHFYCESCKGYICKEVTILTKCPHCDLPFDVATNLKSGSFMIYLPLSSSLKDVLESLKKNSQQLINKAEWVWDDTIRDIFDGDVMRDHIQNKTFGQWDLTLLWNCDGIPVFESSQCSLWPIQVTINELPPVMRKEHILLSSLWFGKSKPVIETFLKPFVEEMEVLKETGLKWIDGDEIRTSRVFAVVSACDAVARPMLKNSTQFNGKYGCDWCLHPGERVEKGNGFVNTYPYDDSPVEKRQHQQWEEDAIKASQEGSAVRGVKGISPLLFLPFFNIITGFIPEYMHAVLLGVVRQFMTLWFDSSYHCKAWYIGTRKQVLNSRLLSLKPPKEVTRTPTSLDKLKFWKASEFKNWLLYYSFAVLQGVLPSEYLNHWLLLVYAMYTLLMSNISRQAVQKADLALHKFVIQVATLYGREHVSFNVHQLTHLADTVKLWGPLWCLSAFTFESNNHNLMLYFHGTQCVPEQVCRTFLLWRYIFRQTITEQSSLVFSFCNRLTGVREVKRCFVLNNIHLFGTPKFQALTPSQLAAVNRTFNVMVLRPLQFFNRFLHGGTLYTSTTYMRMQKRVNSVAMLQDGSFLQIQHLVLLRGHCHCASSDCSCEPVPVILGHPLKKKAKALFTDRQLNLCIDFVTEVTESLETIAVPVSSLKTKCVFIKIRENCQHN